MAEPRPMTSFARASAAAVTARSTAPGEGRPPCAHTPTLCYETGMLLKPSSTTVHPSALHHGTAAHPVRRPLKALLSQAVICSS